MNPRGALTRGELETYREQGYVLAKGLFGADEIDLLRRAAKEDRALDEHAYSVADGEGGNIRLSLWNHPGNGIYGMFARCRRMVDSAELLLSGEAYHYHSKMIMKEPRVGGAFTWHQDYGYWYQNGVLFPTLTSCSIAVDRATKENGCLQVIRGSHELGRIDHVLSGAQAGADRDRVDEIVKVLPVDYVEMDPGDALFFHSNLLHRSDKNESENPRWSMICCYNAARNNPYKESHHPRYTPLEKVDDTTILEVGVKRFADDASDVAWLQKEEDLSAKSLDPGEAGLAD
jgi:phytanoyl-CoA dioxygenase PhyH